MSLTIALPPTPRPVPDVEADPAGVRAYAAALLAASAQVDDLGGFVAGGARIGDWSGEASTAYHDAIRPLGRRADAMSLALRGVSRRVDDHAETLQLLLDRREALVEELTALIELIYDLKTRAQGAPADEAAVIRAECDEGTRRVRRFDADVQRLLTDLLTEEEAMRAAFERVLTLDRVDRHYAGSADPADAALAAMPGADATPAEVKAWWDGLTAAAQLAVLAAAPGAIGNRDGIPAAARDAANRTALQRDLAAWTLLEERGELTDEEETWLENARSASDAVRTIQAGVDPETGDHVTAQVYLYDPTAFGGDGAIAVAAGDLDTADNVSVVVPGFLTDAESAGRQADRALNLYEAARFLDGSQTNASMFWIGYDAPDNVPWGEGWDAAGVGAEQMATAGGERLADTLGGLRAARDGEPAHLTAIGHSYGSTTAGHAAHDHGIPVDDLVLTGSPGAGGDTDHARDTGVDPAHVWAGSNSRDVVANLGNNGAVHLESVLVGAGLGDDPVEDDFGAIRFQAESTAPADLVDDHSLYFEHDTESLYNIAQVVNGHYDQVVLADHLHDPWYAGPQDPESVRQPTAPDTDGLP